MARGTVMAGKRATVEVTEIIYVGEGKGNKGGDYVTVEGTVTFTQVGINWQSRPIYSVTFNGTELGKIEALQYTPSTKVGRFRHEHKPRVAFQVVGGNHRLHHETRKLAAIALIKQAQWQKAQTFAQ